LVTPPINGLVTAHYNSSTTGVLSRLLNKIEPHAGNFHPIFFALPGIVKRRAPACPERNDPHRGKDSEGDPL
jgi:hypothetical protein